MEQIVREEGTVSQEEKVLGFLRELRFELNDFKGERFVCQYLDERKATKEFAWDIVAYLHRTWDQQNWNIDKDSGYRILEGTALYLERFSDEKDKLMLDILRKSLEKLVDDERMIHARGAPQPKLQAMPQPKPQPKVAVAVSTEGLSSIDAELMEFAARGRRV